MNKLYIKHITYVLVFVLNIGYLISKDNHNDLLNKLNEKFPAEIYFSQIDSDNNFTRGWMIIGKKGLARVEFEPPNHFIMIADGNWLILHDAQYDRTSYLPLEGGILGALLYPDKFDQKNKLNVFKKIDNNSYYSVFSESFKESELRVYFDDKFEDLLGWDIIENKITTISIKVLQIKKIKNLEKLDENIFKFPEFMRASINGFLGPYDRKLKNLPTSNSN